MSKIQAELGHVVTKTNEKPKSPNAAPHFHVVWVWHEGNPVLLMMTDREINEALARTNLNPEDETELVDSPIRERNKELEKEAAYWEWRSKNWIARLFSEAPPRGKHFRRIGS